ncbi:MAG: hypothetical protein KKA73_10825 [Chloroflexi bacterium]|nr:hypothetical protein [Chloroflexota bacterium]MBU1748171.1 hypothetical protein [Chloroflexota bacterium]
MIDDYAAAMTLLHAMEAHLPIPARPASSFVRAMRAQGVTVARDQALQIRHVLYLGDEGGIACDVTPVGPADPAVVVSITHLKVKRSHPLGEEIRAYQMQRMRRLAQAEGPRQPSSFTVRPRRR